MKERKPFCLKIPLILWNFALTAFAAAGAYCSLTEFSVVYSKSGVLGTVCNNGVHLESTHFWLHLFVLSTALEFGNTAFILLRKEPLKFFHYYHGVESCFVSFYIYSNGSSAILRYYATVSFVVNFCVRGYHSLAAVGMATRKKSETLETLMRLVQSVFLLFAILFAINVNANCLTFGANGVGTNIDSLHVMLIFNILSFPGLIMRKMPLLFALEIM